MKTEKRLVTILILFVLIAVPDNGSMPKVQAQEWLTDWSYRCPVTVTNTSESPLTDHQVQVTLDDTFAFGHAQSDGDDLRVTDSDGTSLIPFWIEEWDATNQIARIWVKVPSIPVDGTTIYLYYGNLAASSASDGHTTFEFFDDFEEWDSSSSWVERAPLPLSMTGYGKADNTAAVYDGKLYVFGGYGANSGDWLDETYEYDPSSDTWTQKTNMPTARWGMVAVEFNGLIHVFAGTAGNVHEIYNPADDSWSTGAAVPADLANQGLMGVRYGDTIHLFYQSAHYEYDPDALEDPYTAKANVPTPRTWGTCAVVGDSIYVIGGYSYGTPSGATNVNEIYDPGTDNWSTGAPLPVSKYGVTRENPVIGGKIYVTHGLNGGFHTDNYVYDPATNSWEQKSPAIHPRDGMGCGVIDDKLYVVGGRDVVSGPQGLVYNEEYDPATDSWIPVQWTVSNASRVRADASAAYEGNYGLLVDDTTNGYDYAEHLYSVPKATLALDLYWNLTDAYGASGEPYALQPQSRVLLTGSIAHGALYYYRHTDGIPKFDWYHGLPWTGCGGGSYNTWYDVTIVWNGSNSKVIVNGAEQSVAAAAVASDRIRLDSAPQEESLIYYDLVRVRKYAAPEPTATVGEEERPTAVTLARFEAEAGLRRVTLTWETVSEVDNLGFNIHRAESVTGSRKKVNADLIHTQAPGSPVGAVYEFTDEGVVPGATYYYWLEDVDVYGVSTLHGPVRAQVPMVPKLLPSRPRPLPIVRLQSE